MHTGHQVSGQQEQSHDVHSKTDVQRAIPSSPAGIRSAPRRWCSLESICTGKVVQSTIFHPCWRHKMFCSVQTLVLVGSHALQLVHQHLLQFRHALAFL